MTILRHAAERKRSQQFAAWTKLSSPLYYYTQSRFFLAELVIKPAFKRKIFENINLKNLRPLSYFLNELFIAQVVSIVLKQKVECNN